MRYYTNTISSKIEVLMRRKVAILTLIVPLLLLTIFPVLTGCNRTRFTEEELERMELYREMAFYASAMRFENNKVREPGDLIAAQFIFGELRDYLWREIWDWPHPDEDRVFWWTEIVLVRSAAEAAGFPDHVLVAWPSEYAEGLIVGIHWAVDKDENEVAKTIPSFRRDVIHLEDFGLSYPLTVADLVDNWEKVYALWSNLTPGEEAAIQRSAPYGG